MSTRTRHRFPPGALAAALAGLAVAAAATPLARPPAVRFNRDVRPILSDNCFQCHGPDSAARAAGLRLDLRAEALARRAIVPGKPEQSRLAARVFEKNAARAMPPPGAHKQLSTAQKETLRRWIAQGAPYEAHWALTPLPARVPVPVVKDRAWPRGDLDRFVLARLEAEGLRPSPPAAPADWLRRVTLDLTGVPPTPEEVDAFVADAGAGARERVVDRLLASPRYGERMAIPWLDVARYADSYGYQSDQLCTTWPYRDWVVRALNENLPYDQFLTWQLAGDLLPQATREQRLATAFNRLHRMTNEGGSVPEEWRLEGVADRVHTFGTAFLGLTFECARCHDHKYDAITQRDYYGLSAFFNNIDEHGLYDRADILPSPSLLLPTPEQEAAAAEARRTAALAEEALAQTRVNREPAFREWLAARPPAVLADQTGAFDFEQLDGARVPNRVPGAVRHGQTADVVPLVEGPTGKAAALDGENNVHFPDLGRFTRHTPFTIAFRLKDPRVAAEPAVVFQACSGTDAGPHGYDLMLEKGRLSARLFRHWPGNAIGVQTRAEVAKDRWTHVAVTYDGSSRAAGLKIYLDGRPAALEILRDRLQKGTGVHTLTFGQRFRDRGFKGGLLDDVALFERALTPLEVAHLHDGRSLAAALAAPAGHEAALRDYYFSAVDSETRRARAALANARQRVWATEDPQVEVAVMEEMPEPRPAHVLARGQYDAPKSEANQVGRITPASLPPFPADAPRDRLGLARWLTQPDHPLTARVAVNRVWGLLFGTGLVETAENFGSQGRLPSHPELLDWLAREFVTSGWDQKKLVRTLVLSATYGQASARRPDLAARDPRNLLLARGPSHRLSAEAIRDTALFAAGLLDERRGGPPVSPYQPGDLWREANTMSPAYRQSVGGDLYRRSLYSVWKRTAPLPNALAFDAVSREVCVARRQTTATPLQALVLLNDVQFVEAARVLAERARREGGETAEARVRYAFRRLAGRAPTAEEVRLLLDLHAGQQAHFAAAPAQAAKLIALGDRKADPALPAPDVAALTVVAQAIMNMDAVVWKR